MAIKPYSFEYVPINGLDLYYEIYGKGEPLVLLHGTPGDIQMFDPILPGLSSKHMVIAVELQGHGHTADTNRPLSIEAMADDIAALLNYLKLEKASVMGYSLGAGVAVQLAIRHPQCVRKLVVVSWAFKYDGWYPAINAKKEQMGIESAAAMETSWLYKNYLRTAPRPEDWPTLHIKLGELLRKEYDWTDAIRSITAPTMIVAADADGILPSHIVDFFELLGGGQRDGEPDASGRPAGGLAILPGLTHYNIFSSPLLVDSVLPFLQEPYHGNQSEL